LGCKPLKRGLSCLICLNIALVIFIGGLANISSAGIYQSLTTNEQVLYESDFEIFWHIEDWYLYDFEILPDFNSTKKTDHYELKADEMHSFKVSSSSMINAEGRYTWSYFDNYRNDIHKTYDYNYTTSTWDPTNLETFDALFNGSDSYLKNCDVENGILNLDLGGYFYYTVYNYTTTKTYTINGISNLHTVDVYTFYQDSYIQDPYSFYGITYLKENNYGYEIIYYIDSETGFLLEYYFFYYDNIYEYFFDYSTNLGMNVEHYYDDYFNMTDHWYLSETTAAYNPVADADIPSFLIDFNYKYEIKHDQDYLPIYYEIDDWSSSVTIEVYINGNFYEMLFGKSNGYHTYYLYTPDIPLDILGHDLEFVVYDDSNFDHNSTWYLWLDEKRDEIIPDTIPPSLDGPSGTLYIKEGNMEEIKWFIYDDNPQNFTVWKNGTILLNETWYNPSDEIVIDLSTLAIGTWVFDVLISDIQGNTNYTSVTVIVTASTDEPEEPEPDDNNDGTTINLDAPNILYVLLGFASMIALTMIRKKK